MSGGAVTKTSLLLVFAKRRQEEVRAVAHFMVDLGLEMLFSNPDGTNPGAPESSKAAGSGPGGPVIEMKKAANKEDA